MIILIIVLGVLFVLALGVLVYFVGLYNHLVALKNNVEKALANIDVLLKQRHDELPKLIEVCKQYMGYESDTFEKITQARTAVASAQQSGDIKALGAAETAMRGSLGGLFMVAEAYPDLKADKSFGHLQERISELEEAISDRRELYNESVNNNNIGIEEFPAVLLAARFKFVEKDMLEFTEEETADVSVKALFS